ncbi:hypothetical protein AGOR_G00021200 [Albula goreensis]|uniref:Uncharacterized protein n=1 Tax=Albula goreensis TaxID=1534307 RepID=A0A8T3E0W3_9TELE|nr:hypothetical protein AGOR_G00021200 [Albula goreensis]
MDAEWNYAMNHERAQVLDSLLVEEAQPGMWKHTRTEEIPDNSMITVSQTVQTVEVISDSDSGNSLFLTQHDEQPVRTLRRRRAEESAARQVYVESSNDEESPNTPTKARNPPVKTKSSQKSPPLNWRGKNYYSTLDLPFYDDFDKKKFLRRRQAFIIENAALGGFFKCIKKIKKSKAKAVKSQKKSSRSQKRCSQDSRRACSPPDIIEDLESNEDHDEVKIVELKTLIPEYRVPRERFNPWQEDTSTPAAVTILKCRRMLKRHHIKV